ncbi:hypothetical protein CPY51_15315 [Rhizobium tubonense]|uniref:Uncharacterized protein n=1 Tax=Rhizobium tubonense TaxID=484088 RepID=A0A2W4CIY4_9HYPH|nr:hypothetical protein CPY51_15315 [Rhizobium tubonense]
MRSWKSDAEALARLNLLDGPRELTGVREYLDARVTEAQPTGYIRFIGVADVDKRSVSEAIEASDEVDIRYSDSIEKALVQLQWRDKDPDAHMAQNPHRKEIEPNLRGEIAAFYHSHNKRLLKRVSLIAEHNSAGLCRLLEILRELNASLSQRENSVATFAALAALRLVLILKDGYDWDEEGVRHWFESLQVETTVGPSLLPLVPKVSHTGSATFGSRFWCAARVGSENIYEYAMFPYERVLPLFLGGVRGDREAFFQWVLPQIFDSNRLSLRREANKISPEDWEPFLLHGSHLEWWSRHRDCPWGTINER